MKYSVPDQKGGYIYYEAATPPTRTKQHYRPPRGRPIIGMYPPQAWDVRVPAGAQKVGAGEFPLGFIATHGAISGWSPEATVGGVAVGSFFAGLMIGKWMKR